MPIEMQLMITLVVSFLTWMWGRYQGYSSGLRHTINIFTIALRKMNLMILVDDDDTVKIVEIGKTKTRIKNNDE